MTKSYPLVTEIARKNERAILHALAGVTARHVCEVSGLSESALSRLKEEKLEQYSRALAAMGLVLNTPQAAGQPITWTGGFYFRVRFMADTADFENIIGYLWAAKKIEFVSVKL